MKKKYVILCTFLSLISSLTFAQEAKSSMAVSNPNVNGLNTKPELVAKMMRLEMTKLDKYRVLDEFDMADVVDSNARFKSNCYGQNCLIELGKALNAGYVMSGSYDLLGQKIAVTIKIIDVNNATVFKTGIREFGNQQNELQRMTEIVLKEMFGLSVEKETVDRLSFKNDPITSSNVGTISNSGPRVGTAFMVGSMYEFANRKAVYGGLDIFPLVSMIGYQEEVQYVGTENFSALIEGIINVSGLEQGKFIPSVSILNGFRFGKKGWEFAFGPAFGIKRSSYGFVDVDNKFSSDQRYFSETDWNQYAYETYSNDNQYYTNGYFVAPTPYEISNNPDYNFDKKYGDMRGSVGINTMFVIAFGRTFHAGSLNLPVNIFYSSQRYGGMAGINIGFNISKDRNPLLR